MKLARSRWSKFLLPLFGAALVLVFSVTLLGWHAAAGYLGVRLWGLLGLGRKEYAIELYDTGFFPPKTIVQKGDVITFSTRRNISFWPASDFHPSHEIYPEFDPRRLLEPSDKWSFKFDRTGEWRYHDHLAPIYRGTIVVMYGLADAPAVASGVKYRGEKCRAHQEQSERIKCWEEYLSEVLEEKGLDDAFDALGSLFEADTKQLGMGCHGLAHGLGEEAYKLFEQRKKIPLSPKSAYCAYGFYHGFMEALIHTTGDISEARRFCDYAEQELADRVTDAAGACYHGFGHGLVEDAPNPAVWGNAQKIVSPALEWCEKVALNQEYLFRCASGAFNALEIISTAGKYKLSLNRDDPFWICRLQDERHQKACFTQFLVAAINVAKNDLSEVVRLVNTIEEDRYALPTFEGFAAEFVRLGKTDFSTTLQFCRLAGERFHIPCVRGFALGFLKYGPPENEYLGAVQFCNLELLTHEERSACFGMVLPMLRTWYSADKSKQICTSVEEKYRRQNCDYY